MTARVLTSQADLDRIFTRMERDYGALNKRQQAYAVREVGRVRGELADLLADFADSDGIIKRQRASRLLRDLDDIEASLRKHGTIAFKGIIEESSGWTTKSIGLSLTASQFDRINQHVLKYVVKRFGKDGLVLSDRIWGLSGEIRDELSTVIRSGIIKGDGINAMISQIRPIFDVAQEGRSVKNATRKIRRLARNESVTAHRAAIGYNAEESDIVRWVQFHAGDKRSDECVAVANEDKYGKGAGVYKPLDTEIIQPHINCTSYSTYILDERWL